MRVQRIIAGLLLSVFFLTPLAPAVLAPVPAVGQHCIRQPLADGSSAGLSSSSTRSSAMSCHEAAAGEESHHDMMEMESADDPEADGVDAREPDAAAPDAAKHSKTQPGAPSHPARDHQFQSNGCCTSHDCCNSTVRAQWARFVARVDYRVAELVQAVPATSPISIAASLHFNPNFGRAPPVLS